MDPVIISTSLLCAAQPTKHDIETYKQTESKFGALLKDTLSEQAVIDEERLIGLLQQTYSNFIVPVVNIYRLMSNKQFVDEHVDLFCRLFLKFPILAKDLFEINIYPSIKVKKYPCSVAVVDADKGLEHQLKQQARSVFMEGELAVRLFFKNQAFANYLRQKKARVLSDKRAWLAVLQSNISFLHLFIIHDYYRDKVAKEFVRLLSDDDVVKLFQWAHAFTGEPKKYFTFKNLQLLLLRKEGPNTVKIKLFFGCSGFASEIAKTRNFFKQLPVWLSVFKENLPFLCDLTSKETYQPYCRPVLLQFSDQQLVELLVAMLKHNRNAQSNMELIDLRRVVSGFIQYKGIAFISTIFENVRDVETQKALLSLRDFLHQHFDLVADNKVKPVVEFDLRRLVDLSITSTNQAYKKSVAKFLVRQFGREQGVVSMSAVLERESGESVPYLVSIAESSVAVLSSVIRLLSSTSANEQVDKMAFRIVEAVLSNGRLSSGVIAKNPDNVMILCAYDVLADRIIFKSESSLFEGEAIRKFLLSPYFSRAILLKRFSFFKMLLTEYASYIRIKNPKVVTHFFDCFSETQLKLYQPLFEDFLAEEVNADIRFALSEEVLRKMVVSGYFDDEAAQISLLKSHGDVIGIIGCDFSNSELLSRQDLFFAWLRYQVDKRHFTSTTVALCARLLKKEGNEALRDAVIDVCQQNGFLVCRLLSDNATPENFFSVLEVALINLLEKVEYYIDEVSDRFASKILQQLALKNRQAFVNAFSAFPIKIHAMMSLAPDRDSFVKNNQDICVVMLNGIIKQQRMDELSSLNLQVLSMVNMPRLNRLIYSNKQLCLRCIKNKNIRVSVEQCEVVFNAVVNGSFSAEVLTEELKPLYSTLNGLSKRYLSSSDDQQVMAVISFFKIAGSARQQLFSGLKAEEFEKIMYSEDQEVMDIVLADDFIFSFNQLLISYFAQHMKRVVRSPRWMMKFFEHESLRPALSSLNDVLLRKLLKQNHQQLSRAVFQYASLVRLETLLNKPLLVTELLGVNDYFAEQLICHDGYSDYWNGVVMNTELCQKRKRYFLRLLGDEECRQARFKLNVNVLTMLINMKDEEVSEVLSNVCADIQSVILQFVENNSNNHELLMLAEDLLVSVISHTESLKPSLSLALIGVHSDRINYALRSFFDRHVDAFLAVVSAGGDQEDVLKTFEPTLNVLLENMKQHSSFITPLIMSRLCDMVTSLRKNRLVKACLEVPSIVEAALLSDEDELSDFAILQGDFLQALLQKQIPLSGRALAVLVHHEVLRNEILSCQHYCDVLSCDSDYSFTQADVEMMLRGSIVISNKNFTALSREWVQRECKEGCYEHFFLLLNLEGERDLPHSESLFSDLSVEQWFNFYRHDERVKKRLFSAEFYDKNGDLVASIIKKYFDELLNDSDVLLAILSDKKMRAVFSQQLTNARIYRLLNTDNILLARMIIQCEQELELKSPEHVFLYRIMLTFNRIFSFLGANRPAISTIDLYQLLSSNSLSALSLSVKKSDRSVFLYLVRLARVFMPGYLSRDVLTDCPRKFSGENRMGLAEPVYDAETYQFIDVEVGDIVQKARSLFRDGSVQIVKSLDNFYEMLQDNQIEKAIQFLADFVLLQDKFYGAEVVVLSPDLIIPGVLKQPRVQSAFQAFADSFPLALACYLSQLNAEVLGPVVLRSVNRLKALLAVRQLANDFGHPQLKEILRAFLFELVTLEPELLSRQFVEFFKVTSPESFAVCIHQMLDMAEESVVRFFMQCGFEIDESPWNGDLIGKVVRAYPKLILEVLTYPHLYQRLSQDDLLDMMRKEGLILDDGMNLLSHLPVFCDGVMKYLSQEEVMQEEVLTDSPQFLSTPHPRRQQMARQELVECASPAVKRILETPMTQRRNSDSITLSEQGLFSKHVQFASILDAPIPTPTRHGVPPAQMKTPLPPPQDMVVGEGVIPLSNMLNTPPSLSQTTPGKPPALMLDPVPPYTPFVPPSPPFTLNEEGTAVLGGGNPPPPPPPPPMVDLDEEDTVVLDARVRSVSGSTASSETSESDEEDTGVLEEKINSGGREGLLDEIQRGFSLKKVDEAETKTEKAAKSKESTDKHEESTIGGKLLTRVSSIRQFTSYSDDEEETHIGDSWLTTPGIKKRS